MPYKLAFPSDAFACDEHGNPVPELSREELIALLEAGLAHQEKCQADALEFLRGYSDDQGVIDLAFVKDWLTRNQPLDRWFFVHLIEEVGRRSLSQHKADIARSKNAAPRAFALEMWKKWADKGQGKESFGRQLAPELKRRFGVDVKGPTIARYWLPKG